MRHGPPQPVTLAARPGHIDRDRSRGAPIARPLARANRARLRLPVWAWPNKDAFQKNSFSSVVSLLFMSEILNNFKFLLPNLNKK
jgi:hypothetical protein